MYLNPRNLKETISIVETNINLQIANINLENSEEYLEVAIPYLIGPPGGGKTAIIKQLCEKNNWGLLSFHPGLSSIEELTGIPTFEKLKYNQEEIIGTVWSIPEVICKLNKLSEKFEKVIFFLDDMHLSGPNIMAIMYRLLTDREIKSFKLPDNCAMVLAGNYGNKTGAKTMFSAVINRVILLPVYTDFNDWKKDFALPQKIHPAIITFLQQNSKYFHGEELTDSAWPSPRSWSKLSTLIKSYENQINSQIPMDLCQYLAAGHVGPDASADFTKYYFLFMKFNIEKYLKNYEKFRISDYTSSDVEIFTLGLAIASHFGGDKTPKYLNYANIIKPFLIDHPEVGIIILKEIDNAEKSTGGRGTKFTKLLMELNKLDPNLVRDIINQIKNADVE
jgi:hypothetical protein